MPGSRSVRNAAEGALLVDLYELTMAQLYFNEGIHETPAVFEHSFRSYPDYGTHQAGYCIQAGLEDLLDWMEQHRYDGRVMDYLGNLTDQAGGALFTDDFLDWLRAMSFDDLELRSVAEGRVVHAGVTLSIVSGPLAAAQILETALLNTMYELPSQDGVTKVVVDASVINGDTAPLTIYEAEKQRVAPEN